MSTPICHRTLGPMVRSYVDGEPRDQQAFGCPCLGSTCALWVPYNGSMGRCNDNLNRAPWANPANLAMPAKTGGAS